ncbi:MFS transporter [Nocardia carnea]
MRLYRTDREFRNLATGGLVSSIGGSSAETALMLMLMDIDPGTAALVSTLSAVPQIALAPFAGYLADTRRPTRIMRRATLAAALTSVGAAFATGFDVPQMVPILIGTTMLGTAASTLYSPAQSRVTKEVVGTDEHIQRGYSQYKTFELNLSRTIGQSLAAVMPPWLSLGLDAAASSANLAGLRHVRELPPEIPTESPSVRERLRAMFVDGFTALNQDAVLRNYTWNLVTTNGYLGAQHFYYLHLLTQADLSPALTATAVLMPAAGGMIGNFLPKNWLSKVDIHKLLAARYVGLTAMAASALTAAATDQVFVAGAGYLAGWAVLGAAGVQTNAYFTINVPSDRFGRAISFINVARLTAYSAFGLVGGVLIANQGSVNTAAAMTAGMGVITTASIARRFEIQRRMANWLSPLQDIDGKPAPIHREAPIHPSNEHIAPPPAIAQVRSLDGEPVVELAGRPPLPDGVYTLKLASEDPDVTAPPSQPAGKPVTHGPTGVRNAPLNEETRLRRAARANIRGHGSGVDVPTTEDALDSPFRLRSGRRNPAPWDPLHMDGGGAARGRPDDSDPGDAPEMPGSKRSSEANSVLHRAQGNDKAAFEQLRKEYGRALFAKVLSDLGVPATAVTPELRPLVRVAQGLNRLAFDIADQYRWRVQDAAPLEWLHGIARNLVTGWFEMNATQRSHAAEALAAAQHGGRLTVVQRGALDRLNKAGRHDLEAERKHPSGIDTTAPAGSGVTNRQFMVLQLIAAGMTDGRIGTELELSPGTVGIYRNELRRRFGARTASELVYLALSAGVLASTVPVGDRSAATAMIEPTSRELQLMIRIANGDTSNDIAQDLDITSQAVDQQVTALRRRLGVRNRPATVLAAVRAGHLELAPQDALGSADPHLSPREIDLVTRVANGETTNDIARALRTSPSVVDEYLTRIGGKLRVHNRAAMVAVALRSGMLPDIHPIPREIADVTSAEVDLLDRVANGQTNTDIAKDRKTTYGSVDVALAGIRQKLGARNRQESVALALRTGILPGMPTAPPAAGDHDNTAKPSEGSLTAPTNQPSTTFPSSSPDDPTDPGGIGARPQSERPSSQPLWASALQKLGPHARPEWLTVPDARPPEADLGTWWNVQLTPAERSAMVHEFPDAVLAMDVELSPETVEAATEQQGRLSNLQPVDAYRHLGGTAGVRMSREVAAALRETARRHGQKASGKYKDVYLFGDFAVLNYRTHNDLVVDFVLWPQEHRTLQAIAQAIPEGLESPFQQVLYAELDEQGRPAFEIQRRIHGQPVHTLADRSVGEALVAIHRLLRQVPVPQELLPLPEDYPEDSVGFFQMLRDYYEQRYRHLRTIPLYRAIFDRLRFPEQLTGGLDVFVPAIRSQQFQLQHGDLTKGNLIRTPLGAIKIVDPGLMVYGPSDYDAAIIWQRDPGGVDHMENAPLHLRPWIALLEAVRMLNDVVGLVDEVNSAVPDSGRTYSAAWNVLTVLGPVQFNWYGRVHTMATLTELIELATDARESVVRQSDQIGSKPAGKPTSDDEAQRARPAGRSATEASYVPQISGLAAELRSFGTSFAYIDDLLRIAEGEQHGSDWIDSPDYYDWQLSWLRERSPLLSMLSAFSAAALEAEETVGLPNTGPGPLLIEQSRPLTPDEMLRVYKYRTMPADTPEQPSGPDIARRSSAVGHVQRELSLDELAQYNYLALLAARPILQVDRDLTRQFLTPAEFEHLEPIPRNGVYGANYPGCRALSRDQPAYFRARFAGDSLLPEIACRAVYDRFLNHWIEPYQLRHATQLRDAFRDTSSAPEDHVARWFTSVTVEALAAPPDAAPDILDRALRTHLRRRAGISAPADDTLWHFVSTVSELLAGTYDFGHYLQQRNYPETEGYARTVREVVLDRYSPAAIARVPFIANVIGAAPAPQRETTQPPGAPESAGSARKSPNQPTTAFPLSSPDDPTGPAIGARPSHSAWSRIRQRLADVQSTGIPSQAEPTAGPSTAKPRPIAELAEYFGADATEQTLVQTVNPDDVTGASTAHAEKVAQWWESLGNGAPQRSGLPQLQRDLDLSDLQFEVFQAHPWYVGNADGIPYTVRDRANRLAIEQRIEQFLERRPGIYRRFRTTLTAAERSELANLLRLRRQLPLVEATAAGLTGKPKVQLVAFDPAVHGENGRVIIAIGDLDNAEIVNMMANGFGSTTATLYNRSGYAMSLNEIAALRSDGSAVATVGHIGYHCPTDASVAVSHKAAEGGDILACDTTAIHATRAYYASRPGHAPMPRLFNAVGHSYGSTTTCYAGQGRRLAGIIDQVILTGSPGTGWVLEHADDFGVPVWVLGDPDDPVAQLGRRAPQSDQSKFGVGLGLAPTSPEFGATVLTTEVPAGRKFTMVSDRLDRNVFKPHASYYLWRDWPDRVPTSGLNNIGWVLVGRGDRAEVREPHGADRPGWIRARATGRLGSNDPADNTGGPPQSPVHPDSDGTIGSAPANVPLDPFDAAQVVALVSSSSSAPVQWQPVAQVHDDELLAAAADTDIDLAAIRQAWEVIADDYPRSGWRTGGGLLFRGGARPHTDVLAEGFVPRQQHEGRVVYTTVRVDRAADYGESVKTDDRTSRVSAVHQIFVIDAPGGFGVVDELDSVVAVHWPGGLRSERIVGCFEIPADIWQRDFEALADELRQYWRPNPRYQPYDGPIVTEVRPTAAALEDETARADPSDRGRQGDSPIGSRPGHDPADREVETQRLIDGVETAHRMLTASDDPDPVAESISHATDSLLHPRAGELPVAPPRTYAYVEETIDYRHVHFDNRGVLRDPDESRYNTGPGGDYFLVYPDEIITAPYPTSHEKLHSTFPQNKPTDRTSANPHGVHGNEKYPIAFGHWWMDEDRRRVEFGSGVFSRPETNAMHSAIGRVVLGFDDIEFTDTINDPLWRRNKPPGVPTVGELITRGGRATSRATPGAEDMFRGGIEDFWVDFVRKESETDQLILTFRVNVVFGESRELTLVLRHGSGGDTAQYTRDTRPGENPDPIDSAVDKFHAEVVAPWLAQSGTTLLSAPETHLDPDPGPGAVRPAHGTGRPNTTTRPDPRTETPGPVGVTRTPDRPMGSADRMPTADPASMPSYARKCLVQTVRTTWGVGYDDATVPDRQATAWADLEDGLRTRFARIPAAALSTAATDDSPIARTLNILENPDSGIDTVVFVIDDGERAHSWMATSVEGVVVIFDTDLPDPDIAPENLSGERGTEKRAPRVRTRELWEREISQSHREIRDVFAAGFTADADGRLQLIPQQDTEGPTQDQYLHEIHGLLGRRPKHQWPGSAEDLPNLELLADGIARNRWLVGKLNTALGVNFRWSTEFRAYIDSLPVTAHSENAVQTERWLANLTETESGIRRLVGGAARRTIDGEVVGWDHGLRLNTASGKEAEKRIRCLRAGRDLRLARFTPRSVAWLDDYRDLGQHPNPSLAYATEWMCGANLGGIEAQFGTITRARASWTDLAPVTELWHDLDRYVEPDPQRALHPMTDTVFSWSWRYNRVFWTSGPTVQLRTADLPAGEIIRGRWIHKEQYVLVVDEKAGRDQIRAELEKHMRSLIGEGYVPRQAPPGNIVRGKLLTAGMENAGYVAGAGLAAGLDIGFLPWPLAGMMAGSVLRQGGGMITEYAAINKKIRQAMLAELYEASTAGGIAPPGRKVIENQFRTAEMLGVVAKSLGRTPAQYPAPEEMIQLSEQQAAELLHRADSLMRAFRRGVEEGTWQLLASKNTGANMWLKFHLRPLRGTSLPEENGAYCFPLVGNQFIKQSTAYYRFAVGDKTPRTYIDFRNTGRLDEFHLTMVLWPNLYYATDEELAAVFFENFSRSLSTVGSAYADLPGVGARIKEPAVINGALYAPITIGLASVLGVAPLAAAMILGRAGGEFGAIPADVWAELASLHHQKNAFYDMQKRLGFETSTGMGPHLSRRSLELNSSQRAQQQEILGRLGLPTDADAPNRLIPGENILTAVSRIVHEWAEHHDAIDDMRVEVLRETGLTTVAGVEAKKIADGDDDARLATLRTTLDDGRRLVLYAAFSVNSDKSYEFPLVSFRDADYHRGMSSDRGIRWEQHRERLIEIRLPAQWRHHLPENDETKLRRTLDDLLARERMMHGMPVGELIKRGLARALGGDVVPGLLALFAEDPAVAVRELTNAGITVTKEGLGAILNAVEEQRILNNRVSAFPPGATARTLTDDWERSLLQTYDSIRATAARLQQTAEAYPDNPALQELAATWADRAATIERQPWHQVDDVVSEIEQAAEEDDYAESVIRLGASNVIEVITARPGELPPRREIVEILPNLPGSGTYLKPNPDQYADASSYLLYDPADPESLRPILTAWFAQWHGSPFSEMLVRSRGSDVAVSEGSAMANRAAASRSEDGSGIGDMPYVAAGAINGLGQAWVDRQFADKETQTDRRYQALMHRDIVTPPKPLELLMHRFRWEKERIFLEIVTALATAADSTGGTGFDDMIPIIDGLRRALDGTTEDPTERRKPRAPRGIVREGTADPSLQPRPDNFPGRAAWQQEILGFAGHSVEKLAAQLEVPVEEARTILEDAMSRTRLLTEQEVDEAEIPLAENQQDRRRPHLGRPLIDWSTTTIWMAPQRTDIMATAWLRQVLRLRLGSPVDELTQTEATATDVAIRREQGITDQLRPCLAHIIELFGDEVSQALRADLEASSGPETEERIRARLDELADYAASFELDTTAGRPPLELDLWTTERD